MTRVKQDVIQDPERKLAKVCAPTVFMSTVCPCGGGPGFTKGTLEPEPEPVRLKMKAALQWGDVTAATQFMSVSMASL